MKKIRNYAAKTDQCTMDMFTKILMKEKTVENLFDA
jgi:hypothetical protein